MHGVIYEEVSPWLFLLVTGLLGGAAAWMTGRATALGWNSPLLLVLYLLMLGVAVRFVHHALFAGTMFSPHYYAVDTIWLLAVGFFAYRVTRTRQMVTQYSWLYERAGPFNWRPRQGTAAAKQ